MLKSQNFKTKTKETITAWMPFLSDMTKKQIAELIERIKQLTPPIQAG